MKQANKYALIIHGGAGNIYKGMLTDQQEKDYTIGLKNALDKGYDVLKDGGTATEAVIQAIMSLEEDPLFNAGRGAVFTKKGIHEMDACVMDGSDLSAGAVAGVRNIQHPILLANEIRLHSGHVFLSGSGAAEFALQQGLVSQPDDYFFNKERYEQWIEIRDSNFYQLDHKADNLKGVAPNPDHKFGTVGAAACDQFGNIASGTSTGGMTNKRFNRIGDSPVVGAGTYANNATCAISCTGHGEFFIRAAVAHDISCLIEYKGLSLQDACDTVIKDKLIKMGGEGGLIAINTNAEACFSYNSKGMNRAIRTSDGKEHIAFYGDELNLF
jgi:beta-aspartyl-peptidase (threonine type)